MSSPEILAQNERDLKLDPLDPDEKFGWYEDGKVVIVEIVTEEVIDEVPVQEVLEANRDLPIEEQVIRNEEVYELMREAKTRPDHGR